MTNCFCQSIDGRITRETVDLPTLMYIRKSTAAGQPLLRAAGTLPLLFRH